MPGEFARQKGERIRRIGYDEQHGIWRSRCYLRNNLTINLGILVQETQASQRIIAIRCAARSLVDPSGDHHKRGAVRSE